MRTIMLPIHAKWNEKIFVTREKTIEIRKVNVPTPFKAVVYEPLGNKKRTGSMFVPQPYGKDKLVSFYRHEGCGKVIGEFIADKSGELDYIRYWNNKYEWQTRLTYGEVADYGKARPLYGYHITEPRLYDEPKELSEFRRTLSDKDIRCKHRAKHTDLYSGFTHYWCSKHHIVCGFNRLGRQTDCPEYEQLKADNKITHAPQSYIHIQTPDWVKEEE